MKSACVFAIDDGYITPLKVFFHSLEKTNSIPRDTSVVILHADTLSEDAKLDLNAFFTRYARKATWLDLRDVIPRQLPIRAGDHVTAATFYRLFIANILPPEIDQAVYLDTDMLAIGSIATLFTEPVKGMVAAVDHCSPGDALRLWGAEGGTYFQAGVLVIPVQIWRQEDLLSQFLDVMTHQQNRIRWWDQDVLNIALRDRWQRLPVWCNMCEAISAVVSKEELEKNGQLIHFSGSRKPWNSLRPSPFTKQWDLGYEDVFGEPFDRQRFEPKSPSLGRRIKVAMRSFLKGLRYG